MVFVALEKSRKLPSEDLESAMLFTWPSKPFLKEIAFKSALFAIQKMRDSSDWILLLRGRDWSVNQALVLAPEMLAGMHLKLKKITAHFSFLPVFAHWTQNLLWSIGLLVGREFIRKRSESVALYKSRNSLDSIVPFFELWRWKFKGSDCRCHAPHDRAANSFEEGRGRY